MAFPAQVRSDVGHALYVAQTGGEAHAVKALRGFSGRAVLEIVEDHDGDTYRAVYTVRFADAVYVLHAFQKKSKHGIATPASDMRTVERRLKEAEALSKERNR